MNDETLNRLSNWLAERDQRASEQITTDLDRARRALEDAARAHHSGTSRDYDYIQTRLTTTLTEIARIIRNAAVLEETTDEMVKLSEWSRGDG